MSRRFPFSVFAVALGLLSVAGCSAATEPEALPNLSLLTGGGVEEPAPGTPTIGVSGTNVQFRGTFTTPCLGYAMLPEMQRTADGYLVTLRGRQAAEGCALAIGRVPYMGTLFGVPAGTPRVIVRHLIEDANWPVDTVIDTRVVVP